MSKLHSGKKIVAALRRIGFSVVSQRGSHVKMRKKLGGVVYTAIVPSHKEVAFGTLRSIVKQAGITRDELEKNVK